MALHLRCALIEDVPPVPAAEARPARQAQRQPSQDVGQHVRGEEEFHGHGFHPLSLSNPETYLGCQWYVFVCWKTNYTRIWRCLVCCQREVRVEFEILMDSEQYLDRFGNLTHFQFMGRDIHVGDMP